MFWRFKWFGVAFAAAFTVFMYQFACWEIERVSMVHPVLVALAIASVFAVVGSIRTAMQSGRENLGGAGATSLLFGALLPMFLMQSKSGPTPVREVLYIFPSWGDYVLMGAIAFSATLALLMVFANVPKGKMLIVNERAYYHWEPNLSVESLTLFPWMRYSIERFDEIPVKVEFHCAAGTSVVCEAALAPNVEWCRINGVFGVNTARFKEAATQIMKSNICNRAEVRGVNWMSAGETLDALASLNLAALQDVAGGVSFRCLRYTVTATTTKAAT